MRKGHWFATYSGRKYYPLDPRPADITIGDIAHALSQLCRYTGHTNRFYSVAEHSVLVSRLVPRQYALEGLLHDGTEAYLNDLNRPLKHSLPDYLAVEQLNEKVLRAKYGLPTIPSPAVKRMDVAIFLSEIEQLMHPGVIQDLRESFAINGCGPTTVGPTLGFIGFEPLAAEVMFLTRWKELRYDA